MSTSLHFVPWRFCFALALSSTWKFVNSILRIFFGAAHFKRCQTDLRNLWISRRTFDQSAQGRTDRRVGETWGGVGGMVGLAKSKRLVSPIFPSYIMSHEGIFFCDTLPLSIGPTGFPEVAIWCVDFCWRAISELTVTLSQLPTC